MLAAIHKMMVLREQRQWALFDDAMAAENAKFEAEFGEVIKLNEDKVKRARAAAELAIKKKKAEVR